MGLKSVRRWNALYQRGHPIYLSEWVHGGPPLLSNLGPMRASYIGPYDMGNIGKNGAKLYEKPYGARIVCYLGISLSLFLHTFYGN